jgi:dUTP pyrophosphatase
MGLAGGFINMADNALLVPITWEEWAKRVNEKLELLENPPPIQVQVLRTIPDAKMPVRATKGSSGYDVFATKDITLHERTSALLPTGLKVKIPEGYEIQVRSKSGLAYKAVVVVLNSPGTIDSDYRGDLGVLLINHDIHPFHFRRGDKIGQLVVMKIPEVEYKEVTEDEYNREQGINERGEGGFGSTGA